MHVGDKVTYAAVSQAYCLLSAWLREEKVAANYNTDDIAEAVRFLAEVLKHPDNFVGVEKKGENNE